MLGNRKYTVKFNSQVISSVNLTPGAEQIYLQEMSGSNNSPKGKIIQVKFYMNCLDERNKFAEGRILAELSPTNTKSKISTLLFGHIHIVIEANRKGEITYAQIIDKYVEYCKETKGEMMTMMKKKKYKMKNIYCS